MSMTAAQIKWHGYLAAQTGNDRICLLINPNQRKWWFRGYDEYHEQQLPPADPAIVAEKINMIKSLLDEE